MESGLMDHRLDLADALALAVYPDGWLGGGGAWAVAV